MKPCAMWDYHGHQHTPADPDDARAWFHDQAETIMPHGGHGQVIYLGPTAGSVEMRIDIDTVVGRAAVRWIPDDTYAVELPPGPPLTVLESPDTGLITVPGNLARVSLSTAILTVMAYVATGQRPVIPTSWQPVNPPNS